MSPRVVGIVQARMGSTRLPGKTLAEISGKPLLEHILVRLQHARKLDAIAVATTELPEDDRIDEVCGRMGIPACRGSKDDVLDRYYRCAEKMDAEIIVRITADDPFKDPQIIDLIVCEMLAGGCDYVSNTIRPTYPEGLDIEVFSFEALDRSWRNARTALDREHVTPYIWLHPGLFSLKNIEHEPDLSHLRWTIDTADDLEMARAVYRKIYREGRIFLMRDILKLLDKEPEIQLLNSGIEQFASHKKILREES